MELVDKLMWFFRIGFCIVWSCSVLLVTLAILYFLACAWRWIRKKN